MTSRSFASSRIRPVRPGAGRACGRRRWPTRPGVWVFRSSRPRAFDRAKERRRSRTSRPMPSWSSPTESSSRRDPGRSRTRQPQPPFLLVAAMAGRGAGAAGDPRRRHDHRGERDAARRRPGHRPHRAATRGSDRGDGRHRLPGRTSRRPRRATRGRGAPVAPRRNRRCGSAGCGCRRGRAQDASGGTRPRLDGRCTGSGAAHPSAGSRPGAITTFREAPLKVVKAEATGPWGAVFTSIRGPGRLHMAQDGTPVVDTRGGTAVRLLEVVPMGKARMAGSDWARGARFEPGERLG